MTDPAGRWTDLSTAESRISLHVALLVLEPFRAGSARTRLSPAQPMGGPPGSAADAAFAQKWLRPQFRDAGGDRTGDGDVVAGDA